jgi:hypothetical protein
MILIKVVSFELETGKPLIKSLPNQFENMALKRNLKVWAAR